MAVGLDPAKMGKRSKGRCNHDLQNCCNPEAATLIAQ
jgi:hypothetical protein